MKLNGYKIIRLTPPRDAFIMIMLETDAGISGWGEITGSGHDGAAVLFADEALKTMLGRDPTKIGDCMADLMRFKAPPLRDHCAMTAFSGVGQALWDINARAQEKPLYRLLGEGDETVVPLYANLNRGLLRDRRPEAFADHAERAISEGFRFVKATPFDELTPAHTDPCVLQPALKRLEATSKAVGAQKVAVDCHWRFNLALAEAFLSWTERHPPFYWLEDLLEMDTPDAAVGEFRARFPGVCWAGGETLDHPAEAKSLLDGPARPDIFMPDVKYLWPLDTLSDLLSYARKRGSRLSLHNPSGPISTAFSAHVCVASAAEEPLEFAFAAVENRSGLVGPDEPIASGAYHVSEKPGIGISPTLAALENFGEILAKGAL